MRWSLYTGGMYGRGALSEVELIYRWNVWKGPRFECGGANIQVECMEGEL